MIHPDTEVRFVSPEKGKGVIATRPIPRGTIVWTLDPLDRVIPKEDINQWNAPWTELLDTYTYRNNRGDYVLCWDIAKYVNHSFRANCFTTAYDFEITVRDVAAGEELTDDYGFLNLEEPFEAESEGTDRNTVYPDDLKRFHKKWDALVADNFRLIQSVDQPLSEFMPEERWEQALRISRGDEEMDSLIHCYFEGE